VSACARGFRKRGLASRYRLHVALPQILLLHADANDEYVQAIAMYFGGTANEPPTPGSVRCSRDRRVLRHVGSEGSGAIPAWPKIGPADAGKRGSGP
jgi:hypothetical protein